MGKLPDGVREDFPSLARFVEWRGLTGKQDVTFSYWVEYYNVKDYCLDKKKVKEVIYNLVDNVELRNMLCKELRL